MNMQMAVPRHAPVRVRAQSWRVVPWLGFAALAVGALHLPWPFATASGETSTAVSASPLVHWSDANHDWLLVVDEATRELVVYDAHDGRPLRRLGVARGVAPIEVIVREGDWLIVTSKRRPGLQVLRLPELQPVALAGD